MHRRAPTAHRPLPTRASATTHASCYGLGVRPVASDPYALTDEATRLRDARARVGTTLRGKWHLDSLIAVGGMGAVYEATHRNGMRGAVKVLDPRVGQLASARRRFLREGKLANQVHHVGAVRVLDDDEAEDGSAYLVMELLDGSTLDELAASAPRGRLEPALVVEYGLQILDTLVEASASGIVHRDIKPENLFLTSDGVVKVLDFGIAGLVARDGRATVTRAGETIGTPAFMAPEQARGRWDLVDHQSDLFALGASLYTLMTGKLVHDNAATVAELLVLAITVDPRSLREAMPEAPEALVRAIDGALRMEKSKRHKDAAAMRAALEDAYVALTGSVRREAPKSLAPVTPLSERGDRETSARRASPAWLLVAVALLGIASGTFVVTLTVPHGVAVAPAEPPALPVEPGAPPPPNATPTKPSASSSASIAPRRYDPIYDRRY